MTKYESGEKIPEKKMEIEQLEGQMDALTKQIQNYSKQIQEKRQLLRKLDEQNAQKSEKKSAATEK